MTDPVIPPGVVTPPNDDVARFKQLEARIRALEQKPATLLGRMSVVDPDGNKTIAVGPDDTTIRPDGQPEWRVIMRRGTGPDAQMFFGVQGDYYSGVYRQFWYMLDSAGHIVASDDASAGVGLANPWIPVPMYQKFTSVDTPFSTATILASSINSENTVWQASIPKITHPYLEMAGSWGIASGSSTVTFRMYVGGLLFDSWVVSSGFDQTNRLINVSQYVGFNWADVSVTAQATGTTAHVAAQVRNLVLRQSP